MNPPPLKPGWKMVRFGDVVKNANLVERDLEASDIDRIVGLEHIDPENLHIRRWNTPEGGTSFTRKFVPRQTLFGKRRAYQRKVAYAEFGGICSGDILTFESMDDKVLLPELLPFICQTDAFFDHALGTSAGSLSPRTSWKALKDFEFPLPPSEEQKRIVEILWAADEAVTLFEKSRDQLIQVSDSYANKFLNLKWEKESLGKLLKNIQYGSSERTGERNSNSVPILRIPNVIGGQVVLDNLKWVNLPKAEASKYRLLSGDVLIVRTNGNPDYVGRTAVVGHVPDNCVYASYLIRLTPDTKFLLPNFLHASLSSSLMRRTLRHEIRSSAGNYNLNSKGIRRQVIPLPSLSEQETFASQVDFFVSELERLNAHINNLILLRQSIVNQEIGAPNV